MEPYTDSRVVTPEGTPSGQKAPSTRAKNPMTCIRKRGRPRKEEKTELRYANKLRSKEQELVHFLDVMSAGGIKCTGNIVIGPGTDPEASSSSGTQSIFTRPVTFEIIKSASSFAEQPSKKKLRRMSEGRTMVDKRIRVTAKLPFVTPGASSDDATFTWAFSEFYERYLIKILEVYRDAYASASIELLGSSGIKLDNMFRLSDSEHALIMKSEINLDLLTRIMGDETRRKAYLCLENRMNGLSPYSGCVLRILTTFRRMNAETKKNDSVVDASIKSVEIGRDITPGNAVEGPKEPRDSELEIQKGYGGHGLGINEITEPTKRIEAERDYNENTFETENNIPDLSLGDVPENEKEEFEEVPMDYVANIGGSYIGGGVRDGDGGDIEATSDQSFDSLPPWPDYTNDNRVFDFEVCNESQMPRRIDNDHVVTGIRYVTREYEGAHGSTIPGNSLEDLQRAREAAVGNEKKQSEELENIRSSRVTGASEFKGAKGCVTPEKDFLQKTSENRRNTDFSTGEIHIATLMAMLNHSRKSLAENEKIANGLSAENKRLFTENAGLKESIESEKKFSGAVLALYDKLCRSLGSQVEELGKLGQPELIPIIRNLRTIETSGRAISGLR